jgi:hypothetical protein
MAEKPPGGLKNLPTNMKCTRCPVAWVPAAFQDLDAAFNPRQPHVEGPDTQAFRLTPAVPSNFFAYEASKPELFLIIFTRCVYRSTWMDRGAVFLARSIL